MVKIDVTSFGGEFLRITVGRVRTMTINKYVDNGQNEKEHHSSGS